MQNFVNLTPAESEMVRKWRNYDEIRKLMYSERKISRKEHMDFMAGLRNNRSSLYWLVRKHMGEYIGVIYLKGINYINRNSYLGIYTNPYSKLPGKGKMLMRCLRYAAFKNNNLHTIKLEVIKTNQRAVRFYIKEGFKIEGELKGFVRKKGKWGNVIVMGLVNHKS